MLLAHRKHRSWLVVCAVVLACCWVVLQVRPMQAQSCDGIIGQVNGSLTAARCQTVNLGNACLAARSVSATARTGTLVFTAPGNTAPLDNISRMATVPQNGSAILLGGTRTNPVKILVFGDTSTSPNRTQAGSVFTLRASNGKPTCDQTRSGMFLQTPSGKTGTIEVNGVKISLGSTAYVVPGADLLFDQDPRIDRRQGKRNPNAPLCSGFDSDCGFGDDSCSQKDRLVYGPFCREDSYPYIEPGLYRVTLYGGGEVQAGATDYNISQDYEMMGTQRLSLPGSYTFCWDGLQPGGTGFETIVQARSDGAYVDRITLEYLGHDCGLPGADNPRSGFGSSEMGVMSVYNIQGNVEVSMPDGQQAGMGSGQRIRLYYEDGQVVAMDDGPTNAPTIMDSGLVQWAVSGDGMPQIQIGGGEPDNGTTPSSEPVVTVNAEPLYDGGVAYALYIEAQANDPGAGRRNGAGIDHVYFAIRNAYGDLVYEKDESKPAYCAFGGDDSCQVSLPDLPFGSGDYRVTATAYSSSGSEASATADFSLPEVSSSETPSLQDPVVSVAAEVLYDSDGYPNGLRIEAQAYDPGVGTGNGDGIDGVDFRITNDSGDVIYEREERKPAYCAFGGDSPCEEPISSETFAAGNYEVLATARTSQGASASASANFALDWGSAGGASVEPPADTTPPFFNSISYPSGEYCYGDTISVGADVSDESGIADVTFYYLVQYLDPEFPDYGGYPYEAVDLGGGQSVYKTEFSVGKLNTANFYFTATDGAGNVATSDTITLTGRNCEPVVN